MQDVVDTSGVHSHRCNAFLGSQEVAADGTVSIEGQRFCNSCSGLVCELCGDALMDAESHECHVQPQDNTEAAFAGLTKGEDYQLCPSCQSAAQLSEACNELTCHYCFQHYCYRCGEATANSGGTTHWTRGGCPRFGTSEQPDAAIYDAPETDEHIPNEVYQEAREIAMWSEVIGPTAVLYQFAQNPDYIIRAILDRNQIRSTIEDRRQELNVDGREGDAWRHEYLQLLYCVYDNLNLMLRLTHATHEGLQYFIAALEQRQTAIRQLRPLVAHLLLERDETNEIIEQAVIDVDLVLRRLRRRLARLLDNE